VVIDSIEQRLYLAARLIRGVAQGMVMQARGEIAAGLQPK